MVVGRDEMGDQEPIRGVEGKGGEEGRRSKGRFASKNDRGRSARQCPTWRGWSVH